MSIDPPKIKTISGTEITAYNICGKQHDYMYNQEIGPKSYSEPIYRGVVGHEALAAYYQGLKDGYSFEECKELAYAVVINELTKVVQETPEDFTKMKLLKNLKDLLETYFAVYAVEPFKVLSVETVYTAPIIPGKLQFGMILDLLIEYTSGPQRGDIVVMDHKFVYNFKTEADLSMDAQLPKYIKAVQANGFYVTKAVFNQIRYRSIENPKNSDLFQRTPLPATKFQIDSVWEEQSEIAVEILENPKKPRRTQSPLVCKGCFYRPLCLAEQQGSNTELMRQALYMKRHRPLKDIVGDVA